MDGQTPDSPGGDLDQQASTQYHTPRVVPNRIHIGSHLDELVSRDFYQISHLYT